MVKGEYGKIFEKKLKYFNKSIDICIYTWYNIIKLREKTKKLIQCESLRNYNTISAPENLERCFYIYYKIEYRKNQPPFEKK